MSLYRTVKNNFYSVVRKHHFTVSQLQRTRTSTFMVSTLPAAVIPTRCRIIYCGYFFWLRGASRFQTFCHWLCSLTTVVVSDITRCLRGIDLIMQLTCTTTSYITSVSISASTITPASTYSSSSFSFSVSLGLLSSCFPTTIL